jgi:hypothetical protein
MPLSSEVQDFNRLLAVRFPDLFGPKADHLCQYREHLFQLIAADLQQSSTQKVAGMSSDFVHLVFNTNLIPLALLSSKNSNAPLDLWRSEFTLPVATKAGAAASAHNRETASDTSPTPNIFERIAATPLPTFQEVSSSAIYRSSEPAPSGPSGSQADPQPPPPPPMTPWHMEVNSIFR